MKREPKDALEMHLLKAYNSARRNRCPQAFIERIEKILIERQNFLAKSRAAVQA